VDQAQPEVYPSGFVMPGKRTVVIEKECDECDGTGKPGGQFCGGQFWKCEKCQGTGRISANSSRDLPQSG
jgi:DnaJ-class molecular chaperone